MAYRANRAKSLREYGREYGGEFGGECGGEFGGEFGHMSALLSVGLAKWFLQNGSCKNGLADRLPQNRSRKMAPAKSVLQIGSCKIGLADRLLQNRSCRSAPAKSVLQTGPCKMVPAKWFRPERGSPAGGVAVRIAGTMLKIGKF
jgi:hypothetical protein